MLSYLNNLFWNKPELTQETAISKRIYGYRKDTYNEKSLQKYPAMKKFKLFKFNPLLDQIKCVDLRSNFCPVDNQGQLGSCVFNATAGAYEFEMMKQHEIFIPMSRLFMYYNVRVMEGTVDEDSGAEIKDAIHCVGNNNDSMGTCIESLWPYDVSKFREKPTEECYLNAKHHHIVLAERIEQDLNHLKQSILDGYPIVFGFIVYESFESAEVAKTGYMQIPEKNEKALGGHAVVACGFDDNKNVIICRNSWGEKWGDGGYFYMPYNFIINPDTASDFWSIRLVTDDENMSVISSNYNKN
jgi:C1A family cysteine protease